MNTKNEIISYLENLSLFLLGVSLLVFPLLFSTLTTDAFILPKEILFGGVVFVSMILFGVRMIVEGRVRLRTTPFDLPILIFAVVMFASSYFSVNRYDALSAYVPLLFAILGYFVIVNTARGKKALLFIAACLVGGGVLSSIISVLSLLKIYILPMQYTHVQTFTPLGSLLDQALYLAFVLPVAGYFISPLVGRLSKRTQAVFGNHETETVQGVAVLFSVAGGILLVGLLATVYMLVALQKPYILPFVTGFQTAFAAISQDAGRIMKSFLFGSGYGTYLTDFTRFKQASFNADSTLWTFTFFRSSSFVLELLATTGFLGLLSYCLIIFRFIRSRVFYLPLVIAFIASFLLPFSFVLQTLLFILLALFVAREADVHPKDFSDLEFYFVTLKRGLIHAADGGERTQSTYAKILPVALFIVMIAIVGGLGYLSGTYILSDLTFQRSLVAANANNGAQTYQLQTQAISQFPYRDAYYRIFSQTNLALANSLSSNVQAQKNSSPSAEVQQQILTLIQQSINSGRSAATLSPLTVANWNNLSGVYRSLIGFGENADQFAILTNQQAIALDNANPQQYINLGGIYFQLKLWDQAQNAFQQAIQLKPDYANAYYNLGHALEEKGDLQNAVQAYKAVKQLIINDPESMKKIDAEIAALEAKIKTGQEQSAAGQQTAAADAKLDVNKPEAQLPARNPKVEIPGPTVSPTPKVSGTPTPSAAPKTSVAPSPTSTTTQP